MVLLVGKRETLTRKIRFIGSRSQAVRVCACGVVGRWLVGREEKERREGGEEKELWRKDGPVFMQVFE